MPDELIAWLFLLPSDTVKLWSSKTFQELLLQEAREIFPMMILRISAVNSITTTVLQTNSTKYPTSSIAIGTQGPATSRHSL